MIRRFVTGIPLVAALLFPAAAAATPGEAPPAVPRATVKIRVGNLRAGRAPILGTVPVVGSVAPFAPGQRVEVSFYLNGRRLLTRTAKVNRGA
ncbi:MAG TPA: hypothetical protein VF770_03090, partial [Solirubrobacterales bacterium]